MGKERSFPSLDGVAILAFLADKLFAMNLARLRPRIVTPGIDTGIELGNLVFALPRQPVTVRAFYLFVFSCKFIPRSCVIEFGDLFPAFVGMAIFAIEAKPSFMDIVFYMARFALLEFDDFKNRPLFCLPCMAFLACDFFMLTFQTIFRLPDMVEPDILSFKRPGVDMAIIAFLA